MTNGPRSPRTFLCREHLWVTLESTASELGIPMDDVIEKAMIAYAKTRKPTSDEPAPNEADEANEADVKEAKTAPSPPQRPRLPAQNPSSVGPPSPPTRTPLPPIAHTTRPVPPPPRRPPVVAPPPRKTTTPTSTPTPGVPATSASAPHRAITPVPAPRAVPRATRLVLTHRGQTYEVDKDRFVLGRSKANADLRLPDANVSRQHAAIERDGASWFLVDLGSTNGVTLSGERVSRHAITDGDIIAITTHEIHCSIR